MNTIEVLQEFADAGRVPDAHHRLYEWAAWRAASDNARKALWVWRHRQEVTSKRRAAHRGLVREAILRGDLATKRGRVWQEVLSELGLSEEYEARHVAAGKRSRIGRKSLESLW